MGKRDLKKYLNGLTKEQVEEQVIDLYNRFKDVKVYYDFAFNPKEDKMLEDVKVKISNEYFPLKRKRARMRLSTAQKAIKHFRTLGVDSSIIADLMLYNIEIAQIYNRTKYIGADSFYRSMLKSFDEAVNYVRDNGIEADFRLRMSKIVRNAEELNWMNKDAFQMCMITGKLV
jgi:hypothetical protein